MLALTLALTGCGLLKPRVEYIAAEPTKIEAPTRPRLAIQDLPADPTPEQQDKAMASSLWSLMGYAKQLEELLKPYTKKPAE